MKNLPKQLENDVISPKKHRSLPNHLCLANIIRLIYSWIFEIHRLISSESHFFLDRANPTAPRSCVNTLEDWHRANWLIAFYRTQKRVNNDA